MTRITEGREQKDWDSLYSIFEQAPAMIAMSSGPDHRFVFANACYLEATGKTEAIIGRPMFEVFPELQAQGLAVIIDKVYSTGKPCTIDEVKIQLEKGSSGVKDGYFKVSYQPHRDRSGAVIGVLVYALDITEQVLVRRRIADSEERFRTLIQQSADAIQLVTPAGEVLYSSASVKNVLGYSPKEIQGVSVAPYIHPDDWPAFSKKWEKLLTKPRAHMTAQYRVKHKNGNWVWVETTATNHLETPNINAIVGNFRDITKRKEAVEALRLSEARLRRLVEANVIGIIFWELEGAITYANDIFLQMTGYTPDDLAAGRINWLAMTPPEHTSGDAWAINELREKGFHRPLEKQYVRKDGSRISVMVGSALFDGTQTEGVGFVLDVTVQKRAEAAVKESEGRLRFMAESMPQKVFTAQPDGEIEYLNPQWTTYTGCSFEELQQAGWSRLIHPDDLEENTRKWKASIRSGRPFKLEYRLRRHDGVYHWHLTRAQAHRDKSGAVTQWFGSSTDIEDIKKTTKQRDALKQTTILLEEQRANLIAINQAKDEFISLASHQLRTPASAVKQYIGLILGGYAGVVPSQQRELLEVADESNERQIKVIESLLRVARADAGKIDPIFKDYDVSAMLCGVIREQQPLFETRKQTVSCTGADQPVVAEVDIKLIRMVLENIIDNASKYTPHGKRIAISIESDDTHVRIRIADTGVGIAKQELDSLFKKFTRIENSLSADVGGTGLGLYWAKKVVDLHMGTILVSSRKGRGTTFTIVLPKRQENVPA